MSAASAIVRRVVVATVLCGVVGFACAPIISRLAVHQGMARFAEPLSDYVYRTYERARCERDPATWSMSLDHGARAYAYDADTLTSRNPQAPPLDRDAWDRARRSKDRSAVRARGITLDAGGALVFRAADEGPCAIVQTTWNVQAMGFDRLTTLSLGALLSAMIAGVVGFVLLARPLGRVETRRAQLQRHLADVSHDLKTPIASLHLALEQAIDENHDAEVAPLLSAAMNDAVYLAALTANLRLAAEMREGWSPATRGVGVDLTDVVERVVTRARLFARRRGISLEAGLPDGATPTRCDPIAAEQAVSNVVENAITHGKEGGHVAVVLETSGRAFTLFVADDGPGLPPSELPRLGERTFRSDDARQRDPRGSGLGLAITHEVCARCGWTLAFEPEAPTGLRVTIHGERAG